MAETYSFSAKALTVGYQGQPLIKDITFQLAAGSILTLVGPNGAGKSTILKTISGQLSAIAGTVIIDGMPMTGYSQDEVAKKLSVLLTDRVRPEMMTCFEVAAMGRYPYTGRFGRLSGEDRRIVNEMLERLQVDTIAQRDFTRISDGQRQRVLMARALCQEPEILVLDEPTSWLDIRHKIDLLDILLEESRNKGVTILLSMHEIDLAEKISDYVMCVKGGTVWKYGRPEEIFGDEIIASLYDLDRGCYLTGRGSVELKRPQGRPTVFVIGGGGTGIPHYRKLQKKGIPFAAGILYEFDRETDVARALAQDTVIVPGFGKMTAEYLAAAKQLMLACGIILDAGAQKGELNSMNWELLSFAAEKGLRIVRDADEANKP